MKKLLTLFILLALLFSLAACNPAEPEPVPDPPEVVEPEPEPEPTEEEEPRMSYEEYFSEERTFVWETEYPDPYQWSIDDKGGLFYCTADGKEVTVTRNMTANCGTKNEQFFVVDGHFLYYIKSDGTNQKLLLESQPEILLLYGNSDIVFFLDDTNTIYRYHLESGILDKMTTVPWEVLQIWSNCNFHVLISRKTDKPAVGIDYEDIKGRIYLYDSRVGEIVDAPLEYLHFR